MAPLLPTLRDARVLDAASGTGRWAAYCASQGARTIAADFCAEMMASARRVRSYRRIRTGSRFLDGFADVTICAFALGYAPDCPPELARVTRKGGVVLASDVHPDALRRGWTRTFRSGSEMIEVDHQLYNLDDLVAPDLRRWIASPSHVLANRNEPYSSKTGKLAAFEETARHPAIFVARWIKE